MSAGENTHLALLTAIAFLALAVPGMASDSSPSSGVNQLASAPAGNLIAWWRFDEPAGDVCKDSSGNGHDASPEPGSGKGLGRVDGLFDRALNLSGQHMLRVPGRPDFSGRQKLSFSGWVKPAGFDRYNEIFRKEDGEQRVLFSFQETGTFLSLGLNIGGYVECRAKLDPLDVLDGQWHHCAATFDGEWLRVYLDGRSIGQLNRPGPLTAGGSAPGFIGSSDGHECFQGALDDLRIYGEVLAPIDVLALFRSGQAGLERFAREREERLAAVYAPGASLAETLARTRAKLLEKHRSADREAVAAVAACAKQRHSQDYADFVRATGLKPADYLQATSANYNIHETERLIELLLEYKPLTDAQWRKQSPTGLKQWQASEEYKKKLEDLKARGDDAQCSPEWLDLMVAIGRKVQRRPYVQEAVAPYVKPHTPETRSLSKDEAREALERDWMHQADRKPTPERIRQEITWAR